MLQEIIQNTILLRDCGFVEAAILATRVFGLPCFVLDPPTRTRGIAQEDEEEVRM